MDRNKFIKGITVAVLASLVMFPSCNGKKASAVPGAKVQTYTCPMHPQIIRNQPGTCPICGMDLVPFDKTNTDPSLTLGASQQALANLSTIVIGTNEFLNSTRLNGRLAIDPEQTTFISSRVAGRLEVLYIRETGVRIKKGQPVYKIYSEQLSSLQQEYLIAAAQVANFPDDKRFQQLVHGARQKLLLYGQTDAQLKQLVGEQKPSPFVTYYAQNSGVVAELSVTEGQYVPEGGTIMRLEDYSRIWVEADVYPSEAGKVRTGQQVKVIISGYEDEPQKMTINFIAPSYQSGTQIMQIRGSIPNPNDQWQPGLQAIVLLPSSSNGKKLTLPVDAVIREGGGTHVWVEREEGIYEPRLVSIGMENSQMVEIKEGLTAGERVVVTGAYLLYSEFVLKKGIHPLAAMKINK